jgi:hypothetical protein
MQKCSGCRDRGEESMATTELGRGSGRLNNMTGRGDEGA